MARYAKWIGGGLGYLLTGRFIGGLIGFILGAIVDSIDTVNISSKRTSHSDFLMSLLVLVAAVLKADGKILKSELDYVKRFLIQNFGEEGAQDALLMLRDLLQQEIKLEEECHRIRNTVNYSLRLQLLHFLVGLANADGIIHPEEYQIIDKIANLMGVTDNDKQSIEAMFRDTTEDYYKILEVSPSVTDDEVKKAYRKMAVKYHPDKVAYLGEDVKKGAHEKFQKLNEAYEKIKKTRGMV